MGVNGLARVIEKLVRARQANDCVGGSPFFEMPIQKSAAKNI